MSTILAYGMVSVVSQTVLLQELAVLFAANEIVIGVLLFSWLAGTGMGSAAFRHLPSAVSVNSRLPERLLFATALALLGLVFAVRYSFGFYQFGARPNLVVLFPLAFLLVAPASFFCGLTFTALASGPGGGTGRVYYLESLGAFLGGLAFTFLAAGRLDAVQTAFVAVLVGASFLTSRGRARPAGRLAVAVIAPVALLVLARPVWDRVVWLSRVLQFRHADLVSSVTSRFGNVTVTRSGDLESTYYSGRIIHHSELSGFEETALLPALTGPVPRRILVLGFAPPPLLELLLRHRPEKITAVFQDFALAAGIEKRFEEGRRWPEGVALEMRFADPFRWREAVREKFDLVIVRRPLPETIAENRYFSSRFYAGLQDALAEGGRLFVSVPYDENHPGAHAVHSLKVIANTLRDSYRNVTFVPGIEFCFFASAAAGRGATRAGADRATALAGLKRMSGGGRMVNRGYVDHYLSRDRRERFERMLAGCPTVAVNGLFSMDVYLNGLKRRIAADLGEAYVLVGVVVVLLAIAAARNFSRLREWLAADAHSVFMFLLGFASMTGEIVLLHFYQSVSGHIYHAYAMLIATFMVGLAAGGRLGLKLACCGAISGQAATVGVLLWTWVIGMLFYFSPVGSVGVLGAGAIAFVLNLFGGVSAGAAFNCECALVEARGVGAEDAAAKLYAFDLFGGAAAALAAPLALIPLFGHTVAADAGFAGLLVAALATWRPRHA